jgi:hypothetical protein
MAWGRRVYSCLFEVARGNTIVQLQVRVAEVIACPRKSPLLVIVTGFDVAFTQVASPCVGAWLLIVTVKVSEVDHVPILSLTKGQLPVTVDLIDNCT